MTVGSSSGKDSIRPGHAILGIYREPIRVTGVEPWRGGLIVGGTGLKGNNHLRRILSGEQLKNVEITVPRYDSNASLFRLGIEALRFELSCAYDPCLTLSLAHVEPFPHQLEAVYEKMLKHPCVRFLLADDTGSGKTIMAGLLHKELKLRGLASRTLIVAPAHLGPQWHDEMRDKFDESFTVVRPELAGADFSWLDSQQAIIPLDRAEQWDILEKISKSQWDLIIVDEAHRLSRGRKSKKLGQALSSATEHFLLLTATPYQGIRDEVGGFLELLDPLEDPAPVAPPRASEMAPFYIRRLKEAMKTFPDVDGASHPLFRSREVRTITVPLTEQERFFHEMLTAYIKDYCERTVRAKVKYQSQFASSIAAASDSLERRKKRLEARPDKGTHEGEIARLQELINHALELQDTVSPAKLEKVKYVLERAYNIDPNAKLLIFTQAAATQKYLAGKLGKSGYKVVEIGWRMDVSARREAEREFREDAVVMVATEAAGEGLNLSFCHLMVNYDMPWRLMQLDQRMGRILRVGQKSDCLMLNLVAKGTYEEEVVKHLRGQLDRARGILGPDRVFNVLGVSADDIEGLEDFLSGGKSSTRPGITDNLKRIRQLKDAVLEKHLAKRELHLPPRIFGDLPGYRERCLNPEAVRQFFLKAADLARVSLRDSNHGCTLNHLPAALRTRDLEKRYGPLGDGCCEMAFDQRSCDGSTEWLTPNHPLFEAVREYACRESLVALCRGAIFWDIDRTEAARLDVWEVSIEDGLGKTLTRQLMIVESANGRMRLRQPSVFCDLCPTDDPGKRSIDLGVGSSLEDVRTFVIDQAHRLQAEVAAKCKLQVNMIEKHVKRSLESSIRRRAWRLAASLFDDSPASRSPDRDKWALESLYYRLEQRRRDLQFEKKVFVADVQLIGSALVLPHPDFGKSASRRAAARAAALKEAGSLEQMQGRHPTDLSPEDDRGFDILSSGPKDSDARYIAVAGGVGDGPVLLKPSYYTMAQHLQQDYWLYAVLGCSDSNCRCVTLQNITRLQWTWIEESGRWLLDQNSVKALAPNP